MADKISSIKVTLEEEQKKERKNEKDLRRHMSSVKSLF